MRYEVIFRYIKSRHMDVKYVYARNEMDAKIKFWEFVRCFRDKNDIEYVTISEQPNTYDINN